MSPSAKKTTIPNTQPELEVPNTDISKAEAKASHSYIIVMIIISVLILIIGGFVIQRLFKTYIHRTNEIKAQDKYISALKEKKANLEALKPNYENVTRKGSNNLSTADIIYHAVPIDPEYKTFLGYLENLIADSAVKATINVSAAGSSGATTTATTAPASGSMVDVISQIHPTNEGGKTPQAFTFSISVDSTYDRLIAFLSNVERSLRPINFKSMTISGTSGQVSAAITFETYYQDKADISNKTELLK